MMNISEEHPIIIQAKELEERGLMVLENITNLPVYGEPFISPNMVICLNHQGHVLAEYDMKEVEFRPLDIAVVMPNHPLTVFNSSDDYQATMLVIAPDFLQWLHDNVTHFMFFEFHQISSASFSKEQFDVILSYMKVLDAISKIDHPSRKELIANQVSVGTRMCDLFLFENNRKNPKSISFKHKSLTQFYDAIVEHYRESREITFYANLVCLSPKYFGSIIHRETGTKANDWIARYVIIQAKLLLQQRLDMSIQQISHYLGFSDQASFCRYFKRHANISPSEFREQA